MRPAVRSSASFGPKRLPRLDFSEGVPETARTMVIVPTMLTSAAGVDALLEHLEVLALGNLDRCLHFAILSDFADTDTADVPEDAAIARTGADGRRGAQPQVRRRTRQPLLSCFIATGIGIPSEQAWIGWERKRGKIEEFNRLLRGATDTSFSTQVGDLDVLPSVRYCITLDSDTRLPRDAAKRLIGIIAHPLNQPRFDPRLQRVTEGYGILQPRVSVTMASAAGSLFARTYAGHTGVDPYTTAVSDVYQDLFGEGIFTGKGLYDVDAFTAALEGRVPENALLSHDLFEGLYARTALVTDIEVVDDYPSSVLAHARRQHRWVRGDWQILRWLFPFVPSRTGIERNRLPLIARWKILDNLRRSLVPPATLAPARARLDQPAGPRDRVDRRRRSRPSPFPALSRALEVLRGPRRGQSWRGVPAHGDRRLEDRRRPQRTAARLHGERSVRAAARDWDHARSPRRHAPPSAGMGDGGRQRRARRHRHVRAFVNRMIASPAAGNGARLPLSRCCVQRRCRSPRPCSACGSSPRGSRLC